MADYNNARREARALIVYAGPGLSGKTTNVEVIQSVMGRGELRGVNTEGERTVFYDFLPMKLGELPGDWAFALNVKTVPGQIQYIGSRRMVLKKPDAVVFVADSSAKRLEANRYAMDDVVRILLENGNDPSRVPLVMQYNKRDLRDRVPLDELQDFLNPGGAPAWAARARDAVGVFGTLGEAIGLARARIVADLASRMGTPTAAAR